MRIVSVVGGGSCSAEAYRQAEEVGRLLAIRGYAVLTGGLGGVMEAASRGAKEAGGITVGILPGSLRDSANPFVDIALTTGMSEARNVIVATSGEAVVAVDGGLGTLSEIAFALRRGVPVIGLETWALKEHRVPGEGVRCVNTPLEAVNAVAAVLGDAE